MKAVGILLIVGGVFVGLYLGIWVLFIGGIVQTVEAIKATPISALGIAFGILKIMCSGFVGWLSGILMVGTGMALLD